MGCLKLAYRTNDAALKVVHRKYASDRNSCTEAYRYGFNGKENDDEISVGGGDLDFGARIYDSRLGRWLSVDPKFKNQPGWSPYKSFLNNPIFYIDPDGRTEWATVITKNEKTGKTTATIVKLNDEVFTDNIIHEVADGLGGYSNQKYWYDRNTILLITTDKNGKTTTTTTTTLMTDDIKVKTSGPLLNSRTYANAKSWLFESDESLDKTIEKMSKGLIKGYGVDPQIVKDPVNDKGSDWGAALLFLLKRDDFNPVINQGYDVDDSDRARASTQQQKDKAKQGDTLISLYGDGDGNTWLAPTVKDTTVPSKERNVGGKATEKQIKKHGNK